MADTAAKLVVTSFEEIPTLQKITVTIGKQAERPPYWVMCINNPSTPRISLSTGSYSFTLCPLWRTIPETGRRCMQAFTKTSNQLRLKVRNATLRSLHHTSLYRRIILKAEAQGGRTNTVGTAINYYIRKSPKDDITLLKFIYGKLHNGKLAYRYKLAPTETCPLCGLPDSHASQENAKLTTINSLADTTQLANSPTQPLELRSKAAAQTTHHMTLES